MTLSDNKSLEPITTLPGLAVAHSGYAESYQRMPEWRYSEYWDQLAQMAQQLPYWVKCVWSTCCRSKRL